jgi:hypothetical protein
MLTIEISVRSQCPYGLVAMVPSKMELKLNMLIIERHADSQLRCDFDLVILSYMSKEKAFLATEMQNATRTRTQALYG